MPELNYFAYHTTGLAAKALSALSKARIHPSGEENIPDNPTIFAINHFTRIETILMPIVIHKLTRTPIWSLADAGLFVGALGGLLNRVGAVSTRSPDRDRLIVKSLLTGEANWVIYPEGRMVKNKKIMEKGRFMITVDDRKHPPHTGAAILAMRAEFYRQRMLKGWNGDREAMEELLERFRIASVEDLSEKPTCIVPVNITYYPIRSRENALSQLAVKLVDNIPERMMEELMTEGSMLVHGVDVDVRFGKPLRMDETIRRHFTPENGEGGPPVDFDEPASKNITRKVSVEVMQRYMTDIYRMTTVNHDHLFASILRLTPFKRIREKDLRRRVFLAITSRIDTSEIHMHKSLQQDQVHLLTDDRYNKVGDFLAVAEEKGILTPQDGILVKNARKMNAPWDFHRIRVNNPIAVMANAVEPLKGLQRSLLRIAWRPAFMVRREVSRLLLKRAMKEYKEDYKAFYVEGESKSIKVGSPFLIKGRSRSLGVLLIHGYMAAPPEVRKLAEFLAGKGVWVYAPRLKGHGTSPEDLATRTYTDWVRSVEEGYALIGSICKRVVLGGFSTGAGLALDLAVRLGDSPGVFAVSTPLRLQDAAAKLVPAVDVWNRLMKKIHRDGPRKEFLDNNPENPHINYHRNPVSGIRELERLMDRLEPELPRLASPALVVQSKGDPVVSPKGSEKVFDRIGSEDKTYVLFNFDRHGILLGKGARRVYTVIWDFIRRLR